MKILVTCYEYTIVRYNKEKNKNYDMNQIFNFGKINWGPDEAKGDNQLQNYFLKIPDYDKLIAGEKRFVIGRKGTGKTAILQKIVIDSKSNPLFFCRELTLKEFPITDLRMLRDRSMQDKSQYVNIWSFLILVETAKLAIQDEGTKNLNSYVELKNFISNNFPNRFGGFTDTVKILKSKEAKVSIAPSILGGEYGDSREAESTIQIHYSKVIDFLKEQISIVQTASSYFILFDELDEGYKASDTNKRLLLLSLFRAAENLAIYFRGSTINFRPVIALRSDIYDNLEDNDLNKYDDYLIRLDWQSRNRFNYSLKELINVRIRASLSIPDNLEPWNVVAIENDQSIRLRNKSLWNYLQNRTFERPRDIIKFMKYCQEMHSGGTLDFYTVSQAEIKYSGWFYREFRDEIQSHFPAWKSALSAIQKLGLGMMNRDKLKNALTAETEIEAYLDANKKDIDDVLEILFDYGILGNLDDNGRWVFKYKDHDYRWNSSKRIIVHFGFHKKLSLLSR